MSQDNAFHDADIVWVKLGTSWWPGEVCGHQRQPEGFLQQAKRKPYCVVKFFQEDSFEYVKSFKHILPFNCDRKDEFIRKGHELFKAKKKFMEKFPSDVSTAERLTRSVTRSSLFFNSRPDSIVKAVLGESPLQSDNSQNGRRYGNVTKIINITPNRNSGISLATNSSPTYKCSMCDFQSTRQNVMVLHRKSHSGTTATPRRNSLVNSSTMTAPKMVSVGTSPPPIEISICQTPVGRPLSSALLNDTTVDVSDESDYSSEENTPEKNNSIIIVASQESNSLPEQNDLFVITNNKVVHNEKEVSSEKTGKNNHCKSVEIQKSLLADWIDEDRDEEEEDDQSVEGEKIVKVSEVTPKAKQNFDHSVSEKLPIVSVELLTDIEPVDRPECVISPDPQKTPSKIRNIPKKDRRNIVFADFNNAGEPITFDSSSQQINDDCNQQKSADKGKSSGIKRRSTLEPCEVKSSVDPSGMESPSEESSTSTSVLKLSTEVISSIRLSTGRISSMEQNSVEQCKPSMQKFPVPMTFKVQPSTIDPTVIPYTEKPFTAELHALKPCVLELSTVAEPSAVVEPSTVAESDTERPSAERRCSRKKLRKSSIRKSKPVKLSTIEPHNVVSPILKPITIEPLIEETSAKELSQTAASTVQLPNLNTSQEESTIVEAPAVESPTEKSSEIAKSSEEQATIKVSTVKRSAVRTRIRKSTMELFEGQLLGVELNKAKQLTAEPSTVELVFEKSSIAEVPTVEISSLEQSIVKLLSVESASAFKPVEPFIVESSPTVELLNTDLFNEKALTVESATVESVIVEPSVREPVESDCIKPISIESATVESDKEEPARVEQFTIHTVPEESGTVETSTAEKCSIELSTTIEETALDPSTDNQLKIASPTVGSATVESSVGNPCATEPSFGKLSTVEPAKVTSSSGESSRREIFKTKPYSRSSTLRPSTSKGAAMKSGRKKLSIFTREVCTVKPAESSVVEVSTIDTCSVEPSKVTPDLEPKNLNQVEVTEPQTINPVTKSSLSCFDFQEEEDTDILTSIAKFKKKYISPEKKIEDSRPKTPDAQKLAMELKDKQLSAEIDSLLKTTALPVELAVPVPRSTSNEVRGLPIKERGKRIFKSRNRSRIESCSSVSTTTTVVTEISPNVSREFNKNEAFVPEQRNTEQLHDALLKEQVLTSQIRVSSEKSPVIIPVLEKGETMDDKVTNSEDEIVGRVVFLSSEVYAPPDENFSPESSDNRESHVSSSGMEVHTESPSASDVNAQTEIIKGHFNKYANQRCTRSVVKESQRRRANLGRVGKEDQTKNKFPILSTEKIVDKKESQQDHLKNQFVDKQKFLQQKVRQEDLTKSSIVDDQEIKMKSHQHEAYQEDHSKLSTEKMIADQQFLQQRVRQEDLTQSSTVDKQEFKMMFQQQEDQSKSSAEEMVDEQQSLKQKVRQEDLIKSSVVDKEEFKMMFQQQEEHLKSSAEEMVHEQQFLKQKVRQEDLIKSSVVDKQEFQMMFQQQEDQSKSSAEEMVDEQQSLKQKVRQEDLIKSSVVDKEEFKMMFQQQEEHLKSSAEEMVDEQQFLKQKVRQEDLIKSSVVDKQELKMKFDQQEAQQENHSRSSIEKMVEEQQLLQQSVQPEDLSKSSIGDKQVLETAFYKEDAPQKDNTLEKDLTLISAEVKKDNKRLAGSLDVDKTGQPKYILPVSQTENIDSQELQLQQVLLQQKTQQESNANTSITEEQILQQEIFQQVVQQEDLKNISDKDLKESATVVEENEVQPTDSCNVEEVQFANIVSLSRNEKFVDGEKLQQEEFFSEEKEEDLLNAYFVVEENEPIYEVEVCDVDSNCEVINEQSCAPTQVKSIVDRTTTEEDVNVSSESVTENVSPETGKEGSGILACNNEERNSKEIIRTDGNQIAISTDNNVTESQDSSTQENVETDNYYLTSKDFESTESNSCSTMETLSKASYPEKDNHTATLEDENIQIEAERAETSSDDTSTVISDAEAEFGSPTSMLEEDRVLNRGRPESETPTSNIEYINNVPKGRGHKDKILKRTAGRTRLQLPGSGQEKKLFMSSVLYDMQESSSLDLNEKEHEKENMKEVEHKTSGTFFLNEDVLPKEKKTNETIEKEKYVQKKAKYVSENKEDISVNEEESNTESDSIEDEEEEISSPPIESLQDESREGESFELRPVVSNVLALPVSRRVDNQDESNSSKKDQHFEGETMGESEYMLQEELKTKTSMNTQIESEIEPRAENQLNVQELPSKRELQETVNVENEIPVLSTSITKEPDSQSCQLPGSYYTITQKSDTIIKFNKHKEWNETNVDCEKSAIAGEVLSAAEALLLIPNQPTSNLENLHDLPSTTLTTIKPSPIDKCLTILRIDKEIKEEINPDQEIKEEILENTDCILPALEQTSQGDLTKEVFRRKRRSHMKVTPRKRILDVEKDIDLVHACPKIQKLSQDVDLHLVPKARTTEPHKQTFAEQYEENFVLKYTKDQSIEDVDSIESSRSTTTDSDKSPNPVEKQTPEKVHISVDIENPLVVQITPYLKENAKNQKKTLEDEEEVIPSFYINKFGPKTIAEAEAADRKTIAHIQILCPHVEITRKSSKDDQNMSPYTPSAKPQILNQQILRAGNNQPLITVTAKSKRPEEAELDISNMSGVLFSETIAHEKLQQFAISPTPNTQIVKQFQNQHQLLSNPGTSAGGHLPANIINHGIPNRRPSNVRTKRTPSRQQLQEQQNQEQQNQQQQSQLQQNQEHENQQQEQPQQKQNQHQQQLTLQQQCHQQHQQQQHQIQLQQQQQYQLHQHQRHQQQRQHVQLQQQHQFQQHHFQQQFQLHHQNQIQQQLQEEQQILIQQHQQQLLLQQQLQMQQHHQHQQQQQQQQHQHQHQLSQTNSSEKQMGVDTRGNKYVIIKAPSNTVVMGNNSESNKPVQRVQQLQQHQLVDTCNTNTQRKQRQSASTSKKAASHQSPIPVKSPLPHLSQLPVQAPLPHLPVLPVQTSLSHKQNQSKPAQNRETQLNEIHQHFKEKPPIIPALPATTTKAKGRGRRPKQSNKLEPPPPPKENASGKKTNTNGKRSSGSICEPPRQRLTRSTGANKKNKTMTCIPEVQRPVASDFIPPPIYTTTQQQTQSVVFMDPQESSSQILCGNNMPFQVASLTPSMMPRVISGISIETSDGSGVGYAVPSLPIPGYPETFLLCELIDKKYKEVSSRPLYLSSDQTKLFEVPEELVTEAHRKLTDFQREPNPDVLQVISDVGPYVSHHHHMDVAQQEQKLQQQVNIDKSNEVLLQKHEQLSVQEQASALLCLQEQIVQEQIAAQEQLVQEQLAQQHLVQEQLTQEQLVQERLVSEQLVQEQFVQEQFEQEHFVQEQYMQQQHMEGEQGILQVATIETEEVQDNIIQQLEPGTVVVEESIDPRPSVVLNIGNQQLLVEENAFLNMIGQNNADVMSADRNSYTLTQEVIQELINSFHGTRTITTATEFDGVVCEQQQIVMDESMMHTEETSTDILTVALDDSGLYTEEQFIDSGEILQIETPEGLRLISTAGGNAGIVFQPMTTPIPAKTNETNVLLNQAPKMSVVEIPSDKSKRIEIDRPATATLEDCLTVIRVQTQSATVPTSLELPASVTNPAIVAKTRTPTPGTITMNEIIATGLCHHPDITSLPPMGSDEQELHYEFFPSSSGPDNDKIHVNEESVVADMGEYSVISSGGNFDDPGR